MIGVLTHHWAKDDKIDEARRLLEGNGRAQSQAPGFGARTTLYSLTDPTKITSLVTWDSNEIYDQWRASPERAATMTGAGALWSRPAGVGALPTGRLTPATPCTGRFANRPLRLGACPHRRGRFETCPLFPRKETFA